MIYAGAGRLNVRVYGAPVAAPDQTGWHLRDTTLAWDAATGNAATTSALPFHVAVQAGSAGPTITLRSEDGQPLGVTLDGFHFSGSAGAVRGSMAALTPDASGGVAAAASVRTTLSGLALNMTLPLTARGGTVAVDLRPAAGASFVPLPDGAFEFTQPYTDTAPDGSLVPGHSPEFVLAAPRIEDSGAPTAYAGVTLLTTLEQHADGSASLLVQAPASAAGLSSLQITLPILTYLSTLRTAQIAGAGSCVANGAAQTENVAVGQAGACQWAALARFDLTGLPNGYLLQSATLHLPPVGARSTNNPAPALQAGDSGLSSLSTEAFPQPWLGVAWADLAPAVAAANGTFAQNGGAFDVSALVNRWITTSSRNDGFVLAGTRAASAPALRAETGAVAPNSLPHIDVAMYAPLQTFNQDGTSTQYGIAGGFNNCSPGPSCTAGVLSAYQVSPLKASYMRIGSVINCNGGNGNIQPGNGGYPVIPSLQVAYASNPIAIPVVDFSSNSISCTSTTFANDIGNFVTLLKNQNIVGSHSIYFEIGNEENCCNDPQLYGGGPISFGSFFKAAAQKITSIMTGSNVHLIVGGIFPGEWGVNQCDGSLAYTEDALAQWSNADVAAHPCQFYTGDTGFWTNFITYTTLHQPPNACHDLGILISQWHNAWPTKTIWFTEENWTSVPSSSVCPNSFSVCEGAYLADRPTWLADKGYVNSSASGYVRDIWYEGVDESTQRPLGLYSLNTPKSFGSSLYCPHDSGQTQMPGLYQYLAPDHSCY